MTDNIIENAETVELIVSGEDAEDIRTAEVTEFSIDYDEDREREYGVGMGVEQIEYEGTMELSTEAIERLMEEVERRRFQAEARALFALMGLYKASGGAMSVERYLRRYVEAERRRRRAPL